MWQRDARAVRLLWVCAVVALLLSVVGSVLTDENWVISVTWTVGFFVVILFVDRLLAFRRGRSLGATPDLNHDVRRDAEGTLTKKPSLLVVFLLSCAAGAVAFAAAAVAEQLLSPRWYEVFGEGVFGVVLLASIFGVAVLYGRWLRR